MRSAALRLAFAAALLAAPAAASDSIAELRPGGLVFVASGQLTIAAEDLYISPGEVRVDYVIANPTQTPLAATVAFPMPPLEGGPDGAPALPDGEAPNFLGFSVTVDGVAVTPKVQQRAEIAGIDVTGILTNAGVPLEPFAARTAEAVASLSEEARRDLLRRGLLAVDRHDDGTGTKDRFVPYWTLRTTFHWDMVFKPGAETRVSHRYRPSLHVSAGLGFLVDGGFGGEAFEAYRRRYCMDDAFLAAVERRVGEVGAGALREMRLSYALTAGRKWLGPIRRFRLTIDKADPHHLVSFCAPGVEKTGPTEFRLNRENFVAERDLDILVVGTDP